AQLPRQSSGHLLTEVARQVLMAETKLATSRVLEVTPAYLIQMRQEILDISYALNDHHLV
ncbi:MAG: hypothetical protein WBV71_20055, partial [Roseobacter sp.]